MRKSFVAATLVASTVLLASCAMPYDDPNFDSAAAAEGLDSAAAEAVAEDQAGFEAAIAPPTSIGVDVPLAAAPAPGAVIVSLTDGSAYSGVFQTGLADAAAAVGWTVESVTVDPADPEAVATAFTDALAKEPAGIHISGDYADSLLSNLPDAETAGIPVVCTGCTGEAGGGIADASIDGTEQNAVWAEALATYVATNQYSGEDAGVQIFSLPSGALTDFNVEFDSTLLNQCHNCSTSESMVDPSMVDLADPAAVAEFVVGEMSVSLGAWALLDSGSLSEGVADALAGDETLLSPVVLIGRGATAADIAALQALGGAVSEPSPEASPEAVEEAVDAAVEGEEVSDGRTPEQAQALQAWIAIPQPVMAWRVVDQLARLMGGEAPVTGLLPSQLLTGANAADAVVDDAGNFIGIADYQDQFKALWGVS